MPHTTTLPQPVRARLITEFVNKREEILTQAGDRLAPEMRDRVDEIDIMLEGLAAQELPN